MRLAVTFFAGQVLFVVICAQSTADNMDESHNFSLFFTDVWSTNTVLFCMALKKGIMWDVPFRKHCINVGLILMVDQQEQYDFKWKKIWSLNYQIKLYFTSFIS